MYMMLDTKGDTHFFEEAVDIVRELKNLCFIWTNDSRYDGDKNYLELFKWCWDKKDFGDIAHVFVCNKTELGFDLTKVGETVNFKRVL